MILSKDLNKKSITKILDYKEFSMVDQTELFLDDEIGLHNDLIEITHNVNRFGQEYVIENDLLRYSIYKLLDTFDPKREEYISQIRFYKLLFLLHTDLKKDGVDIQLPYFWYLHGDVVMTSFLPAEVFRLKDKRGWKAIVPASFPSNLKIDSSKLRTINYHIGKLKEQFQYAKTKEIIKTVYKRAPYDFQREYKKFIILIDIQFKFKGITSKFWGSPDERLYDNQFDSLRATFPENDFPELYTLFLQWELFTKYQLKQIDRLPKEPTIVSINKFWKIFSEGLKFRCYENLPQWLIEHWRNEYPAKVDAYNNYLKNYKMFFYSKLYNQTDEFDDLSEVYNESVRLLINKA